METQALVNAFQSYISLILLVVVLCWLWPAYRLDKFRQEMFALRDELFDYAGSGRIDFNDPGYRLLRQLMNGFIRYAHQVTFFRVCAGALMWRTLETNPKLEWADKWNQAVKNLKNEDVQRSLNEFHDRVCSLVLRRIVFGSPILIVSVVLSIFIYLCHAGITSLKVVFERVMVQTAGRIIDSRLLEEEAARAAI